MCGTVGDANDYFATLAYDHRVACGFYDHGPTLESYESRTVSDATAHASHDDVPWFDVEDDDNDIVI